MGVPSMLTLIKLDTYYNIINDITVWVSLSRRWCLYRKYGHYQSQYWNLDFFQQSRTCSCLSGTDATANDAANSPPGWNHWARSAENFGQTRLSWSHPRWKNRAM